MTLTSLATGPQARRKGTQTGFLSPTFEFGGFLFHLVFRIDASDENDWTIYLGCADRAHELVSRRGLGMRGGVSAHAYWEARKDEAEMNA